MGQVSTTDSPAHGGTEDLWQWLLRLRATSPSQRCAAPRATSALEQDFLDLYESFARCENEVCVVAHLGQSIDGFVATDAGDSCYVNGPQNIEHLHRMRALADAVIVGAGTVAADDPLLTTRRVAGPSPVRVILDARRRLGRDFRVFSDAVAPTLLIGPANGNAGDRHGRAEVVDLPTRSDRFSPAAVVRLLAARGLRRIFLEGGGSVVSDFLRADVLDRLQLAVAPVLIGTGRRGVRAPARARMADCLRPQHRIFLMGEDLMYDYDLRAHAAPHAAAATVQRLR